MITLQQSSSSKLVTFFYGKCSGECVDFDLTPYSNFFDAIYEFTESGLPRWYKPAGASYFTKLRCGHMYFAVLNKGDLSLEIEHADLSYFENNESDLRMTTASDCGNGNANITPTPTSTPTPTPTPTPFGWQGRWPRVRRVKDGLIKVFNYSGSIDQYAIGDFVWSEWGDMDDCWEIIGVEQDGDEIHDDYYISKRGGIDWTECIPDFPTPTPTPTPSPTPDVSELCEKEILVDLDEHGNMVNLQDHIPEYIKVSGAPDDQYGPSWYNDIYKLVNYQEGNNIQWAYGKPAPEYENWVFIPNITVIGDKAKITSWDLNNEPLEFNCSNIISETQYENYAGTQSYIDLVIGPNFKIEEEDV